MAAHTFCYSEAATVEDVTLEMVGGLGSLFGSSFGALFEWTFSALAQPSSRDTPPLTRKMLKRIARNKLRSGLLALQERSDATRGTWHRY